MECFEFGVTQARLIVVAGCPEAEVLDRLSGVVKRVDRQDVLTLVDHRTALAVRQALFEHLGAELASSGDEIRKWLSKRPSLRRFQVIPMTAYEEGAAHCDALPSTGEFVAFCCPRPDLPLTGSLVTEPRRLAWHCSRGVIDDLLAHADPSEWNVSTVVGALEQSRRRVCWLTVPLVPDTFPEGPPAEGRVISNSSRVLAIIPHYACDRWLFTAISSITAQTRPPDAIVVVDDASPSSPRETVGLFPNVTLLRAETRSSQWALIQRVIDETDFDAYLHQDADDFSASDRLQRLLADGERTGASLIGTQALRLDWDTGHCSLYCTPRIVPAPSAYNDYSVLHPSSIVSKRLVRTLGGFATDLPFGGDAEFQYRARFSKAIMSNIPSVGYFKIVHPTALTMAPETGMSSPARLEFQQVLRNRWNGFLHAVRSGAEPDLTPMKSAPPTLLKREDGPPLGPF